MNAAVELNDLVGRSNNGGGRSFGPDPHQAAKGLEQECLRLLRANVLTREIQRIEIFRSRRTGSRRNWILPPVAARWPLADDK
jgi:hypothetical protein